MFINIYVWEPNQVNFFFLNFGRKIMLKLLKYSKYLLIWHPIQNLKHWFSFKQMDFTLDDKWRPFIIVEVIWIYILLVGNLIHLKINKIRCTLKFLYK